MSFKFPAENQTKVHNIIFNFFQLEESTDKRMELECDQILSGLLAIGNVGTGFPYQWGGPVPLFSKTFINFFF